MRLTKIVVLAICTMPAAAFVVVPARTRIGTVYASQDDGFEDGEAPSSSIADASDAITEARGGLGVGDVPKFLAPVAAAVAGRRALMKRDEVSLKVAVTESELREVQQDLRNTNNLVTVSSP